MLLYDKRAGTIAQAYATARSSRLPHFDKNARYIEEWFKKMLEAGFENHRAICSENIGGFSERFALLAFGSSTQNHPQVQEELFVHMCYIFVIYVTYTQGFKVDRSLRESAEAHAAALGIPAHEMLWFFKKIIDDVWLLHTHKSQEEEQFPLFA